MGASISYKLKNSLQGALAGGGDPATSPLYVFGPFLSLIVSAGVASITFGVSIWLAVFTVFTVSAMYRYVMIWVTDGSGGSGLSEEEFGSWAVKVNASITVIEYTLTFLVSIAALATFVADRVPLLATSSGFLDLRTLLAIALSLIIVFGVNRGPKISALFFGPATALILLFLWVMIFSVIYKYGFSLPDFNFLAFSSDYIHFTLGGFARILALMTGIEIFANLVASYSGTSAERSKKAFGSLLIVMGTTVTTMLIVGPIILKLSDPTLVDKSVFTQTMDALLPPWLSYLGTLIGIAVLLSAAAASMQGIQSLSLGLRARHYIPAKWGIRNKYDVPSIPSWIQAAIVIIAFIAFGTHEETYLALYAAGVFILLSNTGWSSTKRFFRFIKADPSFKNATGLGVSVFSSICATFATCIIFEERFMDGAWSYLIMVPAIYWGFDFFRKRLGPPPESMDIRISTVINSTFENSNDFSDSAKYQIRNILVPIDGDLVSEFAFHTATRIANKSDAKITNLHVKPPALPNSEKDLSPYLEYLSNAYTIGTTSVSNLIVTSETPSKEIVEYGTQKDFDLICMASTKMDRSNKTIRPSVSYQVIYATTPPVLFLRPDKSWISRASEFKNILVPLDGSEISEQVLTYTASWAKKYSSHVTLLYVPEEQGDETIKSKMRLYLEKIAESKFKINDIPVKTIVDGSGPARTILHYLNEDKFDLITMVSHGRGGLSRQKYVPLGSVTESVLSESHVPILFISAT